MISERYKLMSFIILLIYLDLNLADISILLNMWSISLSLYFQTEVCPWCSIKDGPFPGSWLSASICRRDWLRPALKNQCQHPFGSGPGRVLSWGPGTVNYAGGMNFKIHPQLIENRNIGGLSFFMSFFHPNWTIIVWFTLKNVCCFF